MKKKIREVLITVLALLVFMVFSTMILNFIFHDLQIAAYLTLALIGAVVYCNYQFSKNDQANFINQCSLQYNVILTYMLACMQTPSWAPNITVPANIDSIATQCFPVYASRSFITTLIMRPTNRAPLTPQQLTQVQQIIKTSLLTGMQNGYIQIKNVKVNFPVNNNNEVHVAIEVFL